MIFAPGGQAMIMNQKNIIIKENNHYEENDP